MTDFRALCAELADSVELLLEMRSNDRPMRVTEDRLNRARAALAQAEPQGASTLKWSEEQQPCEECRYNHCIAETPFGRFLISWKGWKEYPGVTVDEAPFGDWFDCWNSVEKAKAACQAEYNRRIVAALALAQPEPQGFTPDHVNLMCFAFEREPWATWLRRGGCLESAHCELSDLMLAVLARWGRPAIAAELEGGND